MDKYKVTKMVMVDFVDGEIKGAHDATWDDIAREIEQCTGAELEELCALIDMEYTRRASLRRKAESAREADEEIALDAMYD